MQRSLGLPECATPPEEVYELAKRRGMDFVTITDHDAIDGVLEIADRPDVFVSVELTARFKGEEQAVHVLCFDITPDDHERLQALRGDVVACAAYLDDRGIGSSLAHPFQSVGKDALTVRHLRALARLFPIWESLNGSRTHEINDPAAAWAEASGGSTTGGSDDHAGIDVGRTYTETPRAESPTAFVAHLRDGLGRTGGDEGSAAKWAHAALALAVRTVGLDAAGPAEPARVLAIAQALADRGSDDLRELGPEDARALMRAWIEAVGLPVTAPSELLELLQRDNFAHQDLERRARRMHERALARAVGPALAEEIARRRYGAAALSLFNACLPAIPYMPPAAIVARDRMQLARRHARPRVGLVVEAIGGVHGVTRSIEQIRDRGVPGFDVEVIGTDASVDRRLPAVAEIEIPFYPDLRIGIPSLSAVMEALGDGRYELLHLTSPGPAVVAAAAIARLTGTPLVFSYDTELASYAGIRTGDRALEQGFAALMRLGYSLSRVVLSPSKAADESLARFGVPAERIVRWDRGVELSLFDPERGTRGADPGKVLVAYAGRLTVEKGVRLLVESFLAARAQEPRLHLMLAGGGPEEAWARSHLDCEMATFLGWLAPDELAQLYAEVDLFVFPSATDTFGQVVLEAHASGLPVVAVNAGGPAELVLDGVTGFLRPPDTAELAAAIVVLARSRELRERLGAAARRSVSERTWEAALRRLAGGYERALETPFSQRRAA